MAKKSASTAFKSVATKAPAQAVKAPVSVAISSNPAPVAAAPKPTPAPTPAKSTPPPTPKREITHQMIAERAYEIHCSGTGGSPDDNWYRAERELRAGS